MPDRRSYDDPCGIARALDAVGERWALLIVRELLLGPKRFTDLRRGLPHASQNVLSQRLRDLQRDGIVRRRRLGPPAGASAYELTDRGAALEPVLMSLARWGAGLPLASHAPLSADAMIIALATTFDPRAAAGLRTRVELRLGDDVFRVAIADGRIAYARGGAESPDATITADTDALRSVVFAGRDPADAHVGIEGDREAAERFLRVFPRPAPAAG